MCVLEESFETDLVFENSFEAELYFEAEDNFEDAFEVEDSFAVGTAFAALDTAPFLAAFPPPKAAALPSRGAGSFSDAIRAVAADIAAAAAALAVLAISSTAFSDPSTSSRKNLSTSY